MRVWNKMTGKEKNFLKFNGAYVLDGIKSKRN